MVRDIEATHTIEQCTMASSSPFRVRPEPLALYPRRLPDTINGRLVDTIPIGSVCHGSTFNPGLYATLQNEHNISDLHIDS
jgi:hypothetical protein